MPPALDLAHAATVTLHLLLTAAALVLAVRPGRIARHAPAGPVVALACGLAGAVSVALLSLATRPATFAVLGTLVARSRGRGRGPRHLAPRRRSSPAPPPLSRPPSWAPSPLPPNSRPTGPR